ncbi:hypothetical protein [Kutzneria sp. 744]|uniref:hypothetical protein n=1 Tax=Kutzneria sp. (strain 744) TaxID=345341 RepID=UPI0004AF79D7
MDVHVHESGHHHVSGEVDDLGAGMRAAVGAGAQLCDPFPADGEAAVVDDSSRQHEPGVAQQVHGCLLD